jgi:hypothetical protein
MNTCFKSQLFKSKKKTADVQERVKPAIRDSGYWIELKGEHGEAEKKPNDRENDVENDVKWENHQEKNKQIVRRRPFRPI